jgi:hypothetical protein
MRTPALKNLFIFIQKVAAQSEFCFGVALASAAPPMPSDVEPHCQARPCRPKSLQPQLISYLAVNAPAVVDVALRVTPMNWALSSACLRLVQSPDFAVA